MNKQLEGVIVLDCSSMAASPLAARCLADWGATVIKVEPPKGDATRTKNPLHDTRFAYYNSGKIGISLDQKNPHGDKVMQRLLAKADVFMTNYRSKALEKLGLDYETLSSKYPGLIWAHVTGYGEKGPDKDAPGYDTVAFWARSGLMNDLAEKDTSLIIPSPAVGDSLVATTLAGGICAALFKKSKTGKGEKITISLYSTAVWSATRPLVEVQDGAVYPKSRNTGAIPLMIPFKCRDGKWIYVAVQDHGRYFPVLAKCIGREDIINDSRYCTESAARENQIEFTKIFDEGFATKDAAEWDLILTENDVAHSLVKQYKDILTDPQAIENECLQEYTYGDGVKRIFAATPVKFGESEHQDAAHAPYLGENTIDILKWCGYTDGEISKLIEEKAVVSAE